MSEPFNRTAAGKGYGKAFNKAQLSIPGVAQRIKSIPVFDKIRCKTCREMRKKELYSENQLNELRYKIYQGGNQVNQFNAMIKCKMCTGLQSNEMLCSVCTEIKMLNDFAKAQRRDPDGARCKVCIKHIAETEPGLEVLSQRNDSDSDTDFSGEEYDMSIALNNSLQGLQIQAEEPSDTSVSGSKSNTSLPEDKSGALEGKRALHGSIISKTGTGSINTMTAPYGKESTGAIRADSVASNASFFGGGVALPNDAGKKKSAATSSGDARDDLQNNGTFFTAFDNKGWAHVRRADRSRRGGGKSVSEFSVVSKGGWGKVKKTDNSVGTWMGGSGPTSAKPSEPFQKMPAAISFFKKGSGKVIGVDEGDDGLPEL